MATEKSALTVLVVDDSPTMRRVLVAALEDQGFGAIVCASDGQEAWKKLCAEPVGLVVCDFKMPKMSGLQLLEKIRTHPRLGSTPFIMITSEATSDNVKAAMTHKVSGYIVKPLDPDALFQQIDQVLGQSS